MATPRLGLVVEDKPTDSELSCTLLFANIVKTVDAYGRLLSNMSNKSLEVN